MKDVLEDHAFLAQLRRLGKDVREQKRAALTQGETNSPSHDEAGLKNASAESAPGASLHPGRSTPPGNSPCSGAPTHPGGARPSANPPSSAVGISTLLKPSNNVAPPSTMSPRRQEGGVFAAPHATDVTDRPVGGLAASVAAPLDAGGGPLPLGDSAFDEPLLGDHYDVLKEAARHKLSARSWTGYMRDGKRQWTQAVSKAETLSDISTLLLHGLIEAASQSATYYRYRRSLCFFLAHYKEEAIDIGTQIRGVSRDAIEWEIDRSQVRSLEELKCSEVKEHCDVINGPDESKKVVLSLLKEGWQEDLIREIKNPYFAALVGFMAIAGVRPVELRGRTVIERQIDGQFKVLIFSAKVTPKTGQPVREYVLSDVPEFFKEQMRVKGVNSYHILAAKKDTDAIRTQLAEKSRKCFPELKGSKAKRQADFLKKVAAAQNIGDQYSDTVKRSRDSPDDCVAPYCFRHALAEVMRMNGFSKAMIAGVLGHNSESTGKFYGNYKRGRNVKPPLSIDPNSIKVKRKIKPEKTSDHVQKKMKERANKKGVQPR